MKYFCTELKRTVELDDRLADFCFHVDEYGEERMNIAFAMAAIETYGDVPVDFSVTQEELSALCNRVLLSEVQLIHDWPKIIQCINSNRDKFEQAAQTGELLDIDIEMGD